MGFLDSLKKVFGGKSTASSGGGSSSFGNETGVYWAYAQCRRCGEPLRARVDLSNDLSQQDDETWLVRKGLAGSGKYYCFQTVEVTLRFDKDKKHVVDSEAAGGTIITADEYPVLLEEWQAEQARLAAEQAADEQNQS